jgi:outer membrane protein assembly factor BamB
MDASSGSPKWEFVTGGERKYDFADYYQSSPVIDGDRIYFGSGDGCVYAIRVIDGTLIWKYQTGDVVHATPTFDSVRVYVGSFDGYFYAIDRNTGELDWKFKSVGHYYFPKGEFQGSPVAHGSLVFVGARDFNLYALNKEMGFCHWNKSFTRGWALANVVYDTTLYIGTSDDRLLIAARPSSGREYWKTNLSFNIFGKIAVADTIGYVGTLMGKLFSIDVRNGTILSTFATDGYEANHLKYFKPDDSFRDDIFEIVKSDEAFIDVEYEIGAFFSTPAISGEFLIVTSADGTVCCLRR